MRIGNLSATVIPGKGSIAKADGIVFHSEIATGDLDLGVVLIEELGLEGIGLSVYPQRQSSSYLTQENIQAVK